MGMADVVSGDDLVVRLLGAIDERERWHKRAAEQLRTEACLRTPAPDGDCVQAMVEDGLWLIQAHRDLIAEWRKQAQIRDQLAVEAKGSEEHLTAVGITAGLWAAVTLVARGYGLEEE